MNACEIPWAVDVLARIGFFVASIVFTLGIIEMLKILAGVKK